MKRFDSLPVELREWFDQQPRQEMIERMSASVRKRAAPEKLGVNPAALQTEIEQMDAEYFALDQSEKRTEAMIYFRLARALSCLQRLGNGEAEEAAYEFFHSLDDLTVDAAKAATELG